MDNKKNNAKGKLIKIHAKEKIDLDIHCVPKGLADFLAR